MTETEARHTGAAAVSVISSFPFWIVSDFVLWDFVLPPQPFYLVARIHTVAGFTFAAICSVVNSGQRISIGVI